MASSSPHQGYNAFGDEFPATSSHQMAPDVFDELKALPGNTKCVDCGAQAPDWGSPKLGILMCFQCSGMHRGLGVHLSFVRSVHMDHWTEEQISLMRKGGNDQCNAFLRKHGVAAVNDTTNEIRKRVREKYDSDAALLYQQVLKAKVAGTPIPTKLDTPRERNNRPMRKMEGFGSSPPPPTETAIPRAAFVCVAGSAAVVAAVVWLIVSH